MNIQTFEGNNKEGKNVLIISGVHGDEITPIECTYRLVYDYDFLKYSVNTITIISAVNKNGIKNCRRDISKNPTCDLNRMFNDDENEDYVSILKYHIDKNDVIIDIHSSPNCTEFLLINQDYSANSYVEFCLKNNLKYFLRYSSSDTIKKYCNDLGKIAFTMELNGMNRCDTVSSIIGRNIINTILSNINDFEIIKSQPKYNIGKDIHTLDAGLISYCINLGTTISDSELFNTILNIDDFTTKTNCLKTDGKKYISICYSDSDYVESGSYIASIQEIQEIQENINNK